MPFPWESSTVDPNAPNPLFAARANADAELAAVGAGNPAADALSSSLVGAAMVPPSQPVAPAAVPPTGGGAIDPRGLPDYLVNPSAYVKSPDEMAAEILASAQGESSEGLGLADLSSKGRAKSAKSGAALPDGSFPIENEQDLRNAISAYGRAKDKRKAKRHIVKRARALGKTDLLPAAWNLSARRHDSSTTRDAVIYNTQGLHLATGKGDDLIWKVACKTGTLALSPGPGQTDAEVPLVLSGDLFDSMLLSFEEKAFPYVTVPETHANGSLENTGFVRKAESVTRDELLADQRFSGMRDEVRAIIEADPEDTRYLLAGVDFTEPDVKEKAQRGTIPDCSIGVKFNYRNKRSGKTYPAAWEHLALTPIPWVDGLVPFGLSQDGGKAPKPYEGEVWVPAGGMSEDELREQIELAVRIHHSGDAFNPDQVKASIQTLAPGDEWSWDYGVRVQALAAAGDDGASYWLLTENYDDKPQLYSDIDRPMPDLSACVAKAVAKRAAARARELAYEAGMPVAIGYSADEQPGDELDLAISFDPKAHPRDYKGRFREVVGNLKAGESVKLPGGVKVEAHDRDGKTIYEVKDKNHDDGYSHYPMTMPNSERAATMALEKDDSTGPPGEAPDSLDGSHAVTADEFDKKVPRLGLGDRAKLSDGTVVTKAHGGYNIRRPGADEFQTVRSLEVARHLTTQPKAASKKKESSGVDARQLSQDVTAAEGLDLSAPAEIGSLPGELPASNDRETGDPLHMPKTVEELLASQQAELEAQQARIKELEQNLQLSQGVISDQGKTLHEKAVTERIAKLQSANVPPALCLAAKTVMLADKSRVTPGAAGLNLSVTTGEGEATEEKTLQSPTDIVEFLLSAVPTGEGFDAARFAGMQTDLAKLSLSAHEDANDEEARKKAVEELERKRHPERFDEDGKRKAA
jgi:hypothetical protein